VSPFAVTWIGVDLAALVLVATLFARRDRRATLQLRFLLAAQVIVIASAIVAASTPPEPLRSYAEWTLMVAVNLGYALTSWQGGAARSLATLAIAATILALALSALKAFSGIVALEIGLVFAVGALLAAFVQVRGRELAHEATVRGVDASSSL